MIKNHNKEIQNLVMYNEEKILGCKSLPENIKYRKLKTYAEEYGSNCM